MLQKITVWEDTFRGKYPTKTDKQVEAAKIRHFRPKLRKMLYELVHKKTKDMDICIDCEREIEKNFRC